MKTTDWEQMTDRERDAWVAENVMGDATARFQALGPPHYTTSASADHEVLRRVRETERVYLFMDCLNDIWNNKLQSGGEWGDQEPWSCYEPGDYSRAAFMALTQ